MSNWEILTEFKTKKGQDVVICNLAENSGTPGIKTYVACPICSTPELTIGYSEARRRKLQTDSYIGYCFRCNRTFLNPRQYDSELVDIPEMNLDTSIKNYDILADCSEVFNGFPELNSEGLDYLQKRNPIFTKEFCKCMDIRSVQNGVAIPFHLDGKLVFYVIRFIKVSNQRRYHMPPCQNKPVFIPTLVSKSKFVIVEGCFDAFAALLLYPEYTPVAVLGSKITYNQVKYLSERYNPDSIIVNLDDTGKSNKTKEFIKSVWFGTYDISIIESDGQDPEEKLKELLNE